MLRKLTGLLLIALPFNSHSQSHPLRFDFSLGILEPVGSLHESNYLGSSLAAGLRIPVGTRIQWNLLQVRYDFFHARSGKSYSNQLENAEKANILSVMTGLTQKMGSKFYAGTYAGLGWVRSNQYQTVAKFGIHPFLSYEAFRDVYTDFGYSLYIGGSRATQSLGFSIRVGF